MSAADDAWTEALAGSPARTTEDWFKAGFAAGHQSALRRISRVLLRWYRPGLIDRASVLADVKVLADEATS